MIYIGLDDTDNSTSRGTGRLARQIAAELSANYPVVGVTRHQLLVDPRIPYTSHNSSAAILIGHPCDNEPARPELLDDIFERARSLMQSDFQPGSDPGLCIAASPVAAHFTAFGKRAQGEVVTQAEARSLAAMYVVRLDGLGGTQDGVIGALAAVGLAACGDDGRYILVGRSRELAGLQTLDTVLALGVAAVCTLDGAPVQAGPVLADKLRPARRDGQPVLYVVWGEDHWQPVKLD
jgi:tRNA(Ile2) C34 agmatinyltransferase TiaS